MRQPAGVRDKLGKGRPIATLQQFDDLRDLGSPTRKLCGRGGSAIRPVSECGRS